MREQTHSPRLITIRTDFVHSHVPRSAHEEIQMHRHAYLNIGNKMRVCVIEMRACTLPLN